MNRFFKILSVLTIALLFSNCKEDEGVGPVPARPHAEVYPEDLIKIEEYLKTHYVAASDLNGNGDIKIGEQTLIEGQLVNEIEIKPLDTEHTVSIWDQQEYPLQSKI